MVTRGIILLILVTVAPSVHSHSNEDATIFQCQFETEWFTNREYEYVDKSYHAPEEPVLHAFPVQELQKNVYSREKRQRIFECISNRTNEYSKHLMEVNPNYQALVMKCMNEQPQPHCNLSSSYRSIDGTCNNIAHPKWGSLFSCVSRYITPRFEGVSGFRQSVCRQPLPDPRTVSLNLFQDQTKPNNDVTQMTTMFGQMVAHDLADTPTSFIGTQIIDCCSNPGINQHPQCAPILIREDDPFYSKFRFKCINFVRASICDSCEIGKRNQMNQVTSYIDLSTVYGSTDNTNRKVRRSDGSGKLKSQYINEEELMMPDYSHTNCGPPELGEFCFAAGDHRSNQHTTIMLFHTLFHREHNRIAGQLNQLNPQWDEETLFQEARKINIAQMQVIIFKDYLPIILGPDLMTRLNLWISGHDRTAYDPTVDATLWMEFSAAAFRLHTTVNAVVTEFGCPRAKQQLRFQFRDVQPLYSGNMSFLMEGITLTSAKKYDRFLPMDMTDFFLKQQKGSYGLDIAAVNIQRGRDLGLPSYTEVVSFISNGFINIQSFEQLDIFMEKENIEALQKIYCDVRDIDLWVGMSSEKVQDNMVVGPSAGELIARQFSELKRGDRFYFEHFGNFNHEQLQTLKSSSLASVMCANLNIQTLQLNVLLFPSVVNPVMLCKDIPQLNLNLWKV